MSTPTRLKNLRLREVSLVKRGANRLAQVLVFKSKDDAMKPFASVAATLRKAFRFLATGTKDDGTVVKSDAEHEAALEDLLQPLETTLAKDYSAALAEAKAHQDSGSEDDEDDEDEDERDELKKFHHAAEAGMLTDDVLKEAAPEVAAMIEKAQADAEAATAEAAEIRKAFDAERAANAKLAERIAKMENDKAEEIAKAEAVVILKDLPGEAAQSGPLATILRKCSDEEKKVLKSLCDAHRAALSESRLLNELGRPVQKSDELSQLEGIAADIAKSDGSLTPAQAMTKAIERNPKLYEASLKR